MRATWLALLLLATATATQAEEPQPRISCEGNEKNLATYLQIHDVLFTQRDSSRVAEFYAPEVISHNLDTGGSQGASRVKHAQMAAMWTASKALVPERKLVDELILCSGDYVVVRTVVHSRDATGIAGNPPTQKPYAITATDIYRFENGKVVERWGNSDLMSMIEQVGLRVVPKEGATESAGKKP
jgi:predicted ester cyclase